MRLITSENAWSCSATALAMILDIDYSFIIANVGHDGSEIINPDLRPPACYKGFHMQELVEVALDYGYAVTPIECIPVQTATGEDAHDVEIKKYLTIDARLEHHMRDNNGILMGQIPGRYWHSVAWDKDERKVYDPRGKVYLFDDIKINLATFWRFDKIDLNFGCSF